MNGTPIDFQNYGCTEEVFCFAALRVLEAVTSM